jgi:hypothetical protein
MGLDTTDPQARCFSDMLSPALSPEHASLLALPSTGRLPSAISAADFSRLCSMLQRHYAAVRPLVCSSTASSPRLPVAARGSLKRLRAKTRSPRFRRDPFVGDVASDPGRATVPRVTAPHMLPSAVATASAPATSRISWLNPTPQTITVYASPWSSPSTTQHSLPGGRYPFPGPDFHRLDRASFAWRTATQSSDSPHLRARKHQRVDNDIAEVRAIRRSPNAAPCACSRLRPPSSGIGATNGGRLSWRFMPALVSSMIIPSIL